PSEQPRPRSPKRRAGRGRSWRVASGRWGTAGGVGRSTMVAASGPTSCPRGRLSREGSVASISAVRGRMVHWHANEVDSSVALHAEHCLSYVPGAPFYPLRRGVHALYTIFLFRLSPKGCKIRKVAR